MQLLRPQPPAPAARLGDIKSRVHDMLAERAEIDASGPVGPSDYWRGFTKAFAYLMDLSPESLRALRLHTYHLTADNYMTYALGHDPQRWRRNQSVDELTADLPPELVLNEPEGGIGHRYPDGRFISSDIVRFQRVVRTLHQRGVLGRLPGRSTVLEIGGGYGGLALHLRRILRGGPYIIVDLPETLLFSATYLAQEAPDRRLYLYGASDYQAVLADPHAWDFILLPNHRLDELSDMRFDLVLNVESLQEMTNAQVESYLAFIQRTCVGTFYSWNMRRNPINAELDDLVAAIERRFTIERVPPPPRSRRASMEATLRAAARRLKLLDVSAWNTDMAIHEMLCSPRPFPGLASPTGGGR